MEYWLRFAPVGDEQGEYLTKAWFDNLSGYIFKPYPRKNRESRLVITYFYTEENIYLIINRQIISKSTGLHIYKIPLNDDIVTKLKPYLLFNEQTFISEAYIKEHTREVKIDNKPFIASIMDNPDLQWIGFYYIGRENGEQVLKERTEPLPEFTTFYYIDVPDTIDNNNK